MFPQAVTLLKRQAPYKDNTYTYDNNGNLSSKNDITYTYDWNDRLSSVDNNGTNIVPDFDSDGKLVGIEILGLEILDSDLIEKYKEK